MPPVPTISSTGLVRRLPEPADGFDVNWCRNPRCASFGVPPDPYQRGPGIPPAAPGILRGVVSGSGDDKTLLCETCRRSSLLKSNAAILEEYQRQCAAQRETQRPIACRTAGCAAHRLSVADHPDHYRRFGRTATGDPRYQCKGCKGTFSVGRPTRRQKRSDKNGLVLRLLINGSPLSKISEITGLSYTDIYRKIDFIHERVRAFTVAREGDLSRVDWTTRGSRVATDSQSLTLNWPTKRERTPIVVQHLCSAHARSGFILLSSLQFDPVPEMADIQASMTAAGDFQKDRCFRQQGRLWSESEFQAHIAALKKNRAVKDTDLYQLPHSGALVRLDVLQYAHAMLLRDAFIFYDGPLIFVIDRDPGLGPAFAHAFREEIRGGRAMIAQVAFHKGFSNDERIKTVMVGRQQLARETGKTLAELTDLTDEEYAALVDQQVATQLVGYAFGGRQWFDWPYHTKSEPLKKVQFLTDDTLLTYPKKARLVRLATLRSVDSYFHRVRSNLRFAARPGISHGSDGRSWDRYYLYRPELLAKVLEIYRFAHNWLGDRKTKETPAMRLGLARGKIYERDLFNG